VEAPFFVMFKTVGFHPTPRETFEKVSSKLYQEKPLYGFSEKG